MNRYQGQQGDQTGLAKYQGHQCNADHDGVGISHRQGQHRRTPIKTLQQESSNHKNSYRQEIRRDGLEVELLNIHAAHGAKKQSRHEQEKNQVGQILDCRLANPVQSCGGKAGADQQNNGQQRAQHQ